MQRCELDEGGKCITCNEVSLDPELIQCRLCNKRFHVVCSEASNDEKWAVKSMVATFKYTSTRRNFMFLCNNCLTNLEKNKADIDGQRIQKMESNMENITKELIEIRKLVSTNITISSNADPEAMNNVDTTDSLPKPSVPKPKTSGTNIWHDTERLATVKAKPSESVLVINKSDDVETDQMNLDLVESKVIEGKIPVNKSYTNKDGNLVVVCNSVESRDALKDQLAESDGRIEMKCLRENLSVISLVGLKKNYEKDEVVNLLVGQNYFLKQFSESNNIGDHIKVFAVKPLKGNPDVFQAFARVSKVVRQGFKTFNDKVLVGISTCKIYDQYHVKRCNNCQSFGHFYKNCSSPGGPICAICSGNHSTNVCQSEMLTCVNCVKSELVPPAECNHRADDPGCPTMRKQQEKLKTNLNLKM